MVTHYNVGGTIYSKHDTLAHIAHNLLFDHTQREKTTKKEGFTYNQEESRSSIDLLSIHRALFFFLNKFKLSGLVLSHHQQPYKCMNYELLSCHELKWIYFGRFKFSLVTLDLRAHESTIFLASLCVCMLK